MLDRAIITERIEVADRSNLCRNTSLEKMGLVTRLERMECITRICSCRKVRTMRLASMDECGGSI
mgnify:CR=1 FL=1